MRVLWAFVASLLVVAGLFALSAERAPARTRSQPAGSGPTTNQVSAGRTLYLTSCASCHAANGQGTAYGPSLAGVGAAAADFQLSTGRMPFAENAGQQAKRKPPAFTPDQIRALVAYVASLGAGPAVPTISTAPSLLPRGQQLFIANCAPCHGATANGGAVGGGALAPPLSMATAVQVGEAMLTAPGQMPAFPLSGEDLTAVATYVEYLRTAPNPGGFSIGGIGPVPEGFVAWLVGVSLLLLIVVLVGHDWDPRRT
ncbi:MAG: cytochrome bc1 complex diheme cytochrome c subunit [Candidatus Limnocylindria bacterium]